MSDSAKTPVVPTTTTTLEARAMRDFPIDHGIMTRCHIGIIISAEWKEVTAQSQPMMEHTAKNLADQMQKTIKTSAELAGKIFELSRAGKKDEALGLLREFQIKTLFGRGILA